MILGFTATDASAVSVDRSVLTEEVDSFEVDLSAEQVTMAHQEPRRRGSEFEGA